MQPETGNTSLRCDSSKEISGKALAEIFFTRVNRTSWECKCGKTRKQSSNGYSNLVSHIMKEHAEEVMKIRQQGVKKETSTIMDQFWPKKARTIHSWLEFIVCGFMPFSFCESDLARKYINCAPIARGTLMKYLDKVTVSVQKKIAKMLPNQFCLVFDGWTFLLTQI